MAKNFPVIVWKLMLLNPFPVTNLQPEVELNQLVRRHYNHKCCQ